MAMSSVVELDAVLLDKRFGLPQRSGTPLKISSLIHHGGTRAPGCYRVHLKVGVG
jgi:hypothetical protein